MTSITGVQKVESSVCQNSPRVCSKHISIKTPSCKKRTAAQDMQCSTHSWGASNSILRPASAPAPPERGTSLSQQAAHSTLGSFPGLSKKFPYFSFTESPHCLTLDAVHIQNYWISHPFTVTFIYSLFRAVLKKVTEKTSVFEKTQSIKLLHSDQNEKRLCALCSQHENTPNVETP